MSQSGHVLETEITAGVYTPVSDDNTDYSIESYLALKIFLTVINTLLNTPVVSIVES